MAIQGIAMQSAASSSAAIAAASAPNAELDALIADTSTSQDELDTQGANLQRALADLHAQQDTFESAVRTHSRSLRALPRNHPAVQALRKRLSLISNLTPSSGGFFVELFLGGINVRFVRKSERIAFKTDYEKLKQRLAPLFAVVCVACLVFEENRWLHMLLQLALTTYYVTLATRENILRLNGSNIKPWWIIHHYLTIMQGVLLLTWPNNASYARFRTGLHYFGFYNAILQIFQTRYQISRLYTLRSLGLVGEMDVANSDSTQIHWSESMKLLLPLIVFGQVLQAVQSVSLFRIYAWSPHELQILLLGALFLANFCGNAFTTAVVVIGKLKRPRRLTVPPSISPGITTHQTIASALLPEARTPSHACREKDL
jgi:TMPIT-like protein